MAAVQAAPDLPPADGAGRRPTVRRRLLLGVAGGFALALTAAGVGYLLGGEQGGGPTVRPPAAAAPSVRVTGGYPLASPTAPQPDPAAGLTTVPTGITWSLYQGVELPYSRTAGPARVQGAVASGFAHTPLGALLAMVQTEVRYYQSPTPAWRDEVARMILPGPGRNYFVRVRSTMDDAPPVEGYAQVEGFRYVTYRPDQAVVQIATRLAESQQLSTLTVRWVDGDWRMPLQPNGSVTPVIVPITSLAGLIPWGV